MPAIFLVRHAQASYDTDDYDRLSELGALQCERLGAALAQRGVVPSALVIGRMRRHRQTAELMSRAAGWPLPADEDAGFDEYDHDAVLAAAAERSGRVVGPGAARRNQHAGAMDDAARAWAAGSLTGVDETFADFRRRVTDATARLAGRLQRGQHGVVVTSGGPIAAVVSTLLGGDGRTWFSLDRAGVTTGITVIAAAASGLTVRSFNEHGHLSPDLRVYR